MSLASIRDFSSLTHEIVDNRLVIQRAVQNAQGDFYDLSIGIDNANFNNAISPNLDGKIQILVQGCLHALQNQLAAESKNVDKLEQLGFIVQKPAADQPYESHALVADAGQSVLDRIKSCTSRDYSSLRSLYFKETKTMKWQPDEARQVQWSSGGRKTDYVVHDGLEQLCEDLQSESFFGFSHTPPPPPVQSQAIPGSGSPSSEPSDASSPSSSPSSGSPHPEAPKEASKKSQSSVASPSSAAAPLPVTPSPSQSRRAAQVAVDEGVLKKTYADWVRRQRSWGYWLGWKNMWEKISLRQFQGKEKIKDETDSQSVEAAIQQGKPEIRQFFDALKEAAPSCIELISPLCNQVKK